MKVYGANEMDQAIADVRKFFAALPDKRLQVKRYDPTRSQSQQALIHTLIRKMAAHSGAGEDYFKQKVIKENLHEVFPHWPHDIQNDMNGERALIAKSESTLTTNEESVVIEHLYALAADWGVELEQ